MKRINALLLCLALPVLFAGCSGEQLHDMTIVQAVGIDGGTPVTACIQYLDLNRTAGSTEALEGNITATQVGEAATLSAALTEANRSLAGDGFFGQNKLFVLGKAYAETALPAFAEYLRCSRDSRPDVLVAMSSTTAREVLQSGVSGARVPAENTADLITEGEQTALVPSVSVNDLLCRYLNPQSDVYLPVLRADKNAVVPDGVAVCSGDTLAGVLQDDDALGFMLAQGKIKKGTLVPGGESGKQPFEIVRFRRCSRLAEKDGRLQWRITLKVTLYADREGDADALRRLAEKSLSTATENAVRQCFLLHSDPFGLSLMAAKDCPDYLERHRDDWRRVLPETDVSCAVSVTLLQ